MPKLTLPEALRYFFPPFVIFFYYSILDASSAKELVKSFGLVGSVASLVAGIVIYYVYRYVICDDIILSLYDFLRKDNQRKFIKNRYKIHSTRTANRILHQLSDEIPYKNFTTTRGRPMRSAGVHLLYQAALCDLPFICIAAYQAKFGTSLIFALIGASLTYTAIRMDNDYENEELLLVKSIPDLVDKAASTLGIERPNQESYSK
jgi:hypothetical protein